MSMTRKTNGKTPPPPQIKVATKISGKERRKLPIVGVADVKDEQPVAALQLRCDHVVITVENINPIKAERMLLDNNINRKLLQSAVDQYAEDMKLGKWTFCTAPIVIYDNGNIADGQHRLWAIIESGKTQKFVVHRGLHQPEGLNIDTGRTRTVVDAAKISGIDPHMSSNMHSAARSIEEGVAAHQRTSHSHKLSLVEKHREAAHFVVGHIYGKKIGNGAIYGALGRAWYVEKDKEKLKRFCEVLRNGQSEGLHESAAVTLRNYLLSAQANLASSGLFKDTFLKAQRAIKYFMQGKQLLQLRTPETEEYPL